jgi:dTDP-glucose 4,6-dehydratase
VHDHNTAADLVLRNGQPGEIYNIGAGNELTNVELTNRLLALTGRDDSYIERVADRLGHDRRYSITHDKVTALGWRTTFDLEQGLADTVQWYRDHRDWWEPLRAKAAL